MQPATQTDSLLESSAYSKNYFAFLLFKETSRFWLARRRLIFSSTIARQSEKYASMFIFARCSSRIRFASSGAIRKTSYIYSCLLWSVHQGYSCNYFPSFFSSPSTCCSCFSKYLLRYLSISSKTFWVSSSRRIRSSFSSSSFSCWFFNSSAERRSEVRSTHVID